MPKHVGFLCVLCVLYYEVHLWENILNPVKFQWTTGKRSCGTKSAWPSSLVAGMAQWLYLRGGADKSLARPGREKATAAKLGIYSTYSPQSSVKFLDRCSNFCKPLKKNSKVVRPTRSQRQQ